MAGISAVLFCGGVVVFQIPSTGSGADLFTRTQFYGFELGLGAVGLIGAGTVLIGVVAYIQAGRQLTPAPPLRGRRR